MGKTRIPRAIKEFNDYIGNTNTYLQKVQEPMNGTRLGLTDGNVSDWKTRAGDWDGLYKKYIDPLQKTTDINKQIKNAMISFFAFAQPLLNIIAASPNAVQTDSTVFNVILKRKTPTRNNTKITEVCFVKISNITGGEVRNKCSSNRDAKRPSIIEAANSVQVAFVIGNTAPTSADAVATTKLFTKADFIIKCGTENIDKKLYTYYRWYDTRHPENAGPWSALYTTPII